MKGLATIHAGSARQALTRLRFLCQLADTSSELPLDALNTLVTEAIDLVVHCSRVGGAVRVTEVVAVEDGQASTGATQFTVTPLFRPASPGGPLTWTGNLPVRLAPALAEVADLAVLLEGDPARGPAPWR